MNADEQDLTNALSQIGDPHMEDPLKYSEVTGKVIGIFFEVYNELGHGFLESVYQSAIQIAFAERGIANVGKIEIPVWFRGYKRFRGRSVS